VFTRQSRPTDLYTAISPGALLAYVHIVAVVVVVATTLLVQSIHTRTQAPSRHDIHTSKHLTYQDTTTTPTIYLSDKSRQSVTLISGRSAINAFAIYQFDPPFTAGPYRDRQGFSRPLR
jgi:hypothetical protein